MAVRQHVVVGVAVLVVAALFGAGLPYIDNEGGYAGLSPRFLPTVVTAGLALCGLALLLTRGSVPEQSEEAAQGEKANLAALGWVVLGLVLDIALISSLGFVIGSVILFTCVARGYSSRRPVRDALIGLALALPIWALFTYGLSIDLPLLPMMQG